MRSVAAVEDDMLYLLPKDYRSFLLDEGNHQHPAWRLFASPAADVLPVDFSVDFPFVHSHCDTNPIATLPGAIPLMHHECDYVVIVVRGQAAGQVWQVWGEDDCAMFRQVIHPESRQPLSFAAWLALAEQEAALSKAYRAGIEAGLRFPRDEAEGRGLMNYLLWVADQMEYFPNEHMLLTPSDFKKLRGVALSVMAYRFCALDSAQACAEFFEFSGFITRHSYAAFVEMALRLAENIVSRQPDNAQCEGSECASNLVMARRFVAGTVGEKDLAAFKSRLREVDSPVARLVELLLDPHFLHGTLEVGQWWRWDEVFFEKLHEVSPRLGAQFIAHAVNND